jgi:tocopherol O-methyltransferase
LNANDTAVPPAEAVTPEINVAVERYYDTTLDLYEDFWGEHVHHGYWDRGDDSDRHAATDRLVRELVEYSRIPRGATVFDVGCGIGGPALYLAGPHGCTVRGVTLSAAQAARATEKASEAGLAGRASFERQDALSTGWPDGCVDAVWALESLMHIPDRPAFFAEMMRLLRPGGTLAIGTWSVKHGPLTPDESEVVDLVLKHQVMPSFSSLEEHEEMARAAGFTDVSSVDWTEAVTNSWDPDFALIKPIERSRKAMMTLARDRGVDVLGFFYAGPLMLKAYRSGAMTYGAVRAVKPAGPAPAPDASA